MIDLKKPVQVVYKGKIHVCFVKKGMCIEVLSFDEIISKSPSGNIICSTKEAESIRNMSGMEF